MTTLARSTDASDGRQPCDSNFQQKRVASGASATAGSAADSNRPEAELHHINAHALKPPFAACGRVEGHSRFEPFMGVFGRQTAPSVPA